jgi:hypothetical protein
VHSVSDRVTFVFGKSREEATANISLDKGDLQELLRPQLDIFMGCKAITGLKGRGCRVALRSGVCPGGAKGTQDAFESIG